MSNENIFAPENQHILLVDDDKFLRDLLNKYMTRLGYQVTPVASSEEAMAATEKQRYQVALIDILLSGMSGIELVDRLKMIQSDMILILMTGHPTLETVIEAMQKGVQDYLIKPFKLEQLEKVLKKALDEKRILLENQRLRQQLEEAHQQLAQYESMVEEMAHLPQAKKDELKQKPVRGDEVYRVQSRYNQEAARQNQLNVLKKMKDEGVISQEEYDLKRDQLTSTPGA